MKPTYRIIDHTADTGVEATAPDLAGLIAVTAEAMFSLMYVCAGIDPVSTVTVTVEASSPEDLLVDVLSELLYRSEADHVALCSFTATAGETSATVETGAVPAADVELTGPPIKAVTYHELSVRDTGDHWEARVVFDV